MNNPFIADNYFKENPSKVLGEATVERGRFGNDIIKVKGTLSDLEKIDAQPVTVPDLYPSFTPSVESKKEMIEEVFINEGKESTKRSLERIKTGTIKEKPKPTLANQQIYSFDEINRMYNAQITRDELEAYYYTHPEINYKLLFEEFTYSKEDLIKKGLICWYDGELVYYYSFISGNVSKKISYLKRDREKLIQAYGEKQYERQIQMLEAVKPKRKPIAGEDRFILLPHSSFAREVKVSELRYNKPELRSEVTLVRAYKEWLYSLDPNEFTKATYREIIDFYIDNKPIPIPTTGSKEYIEREEKKAINTRQRTKEEGDKLFAKFLDEALTPEDQARIAFLWNDKYNNIVEPDLDKIPICLTVSKTFKAGAPFTFNATQRRAAALMMEKKSALLAYGVGVGKTAASIACNSQAFYNNLATHFLYVVPTNTYDKWIGELQGYKDKVTGTFMQGLLPQMPPVVGLFNLNPNILRQNLKIYTDAEQVQFTNIENAINLLKSSKTFDFSPEKKQAVNAYYQLPWQALESGYNEYLSLTKSANPKMFSEYVVDYLRDEYNFLCYDLGTMKSFPEGTIFVTTEVGLQRIGIGEQDRAELVSRLYRILSQGEMTADPKRAKQVAKLQIKIEQTVSSSQKNARILIDDLKINWVCFDEAHYYKKLFTYVKGEIKSEQTNEETGSKEYKREKSKYELNSGAYPSARALSAFVVSHYIQSKNNNRNVVMLTATPFTNSPLEVYSMLTLTNFGALEDIGLDNMVDFFDTFMKIDYDIKYTAQKKVVKQVVLKGYNNLPQLRQVIYSLMDKKDEGANLKRPVKVIYPSIAEGRETTLPMTAEQNMINNDIKAYMNGKADYSDICGSAMQDEIEEMDYDAYDDETLIGEWERITDKEYTGARENLDDSKRDQLIKQIKNASSKLVEIDENELDDDEKLSIRILKGLSMLRQMTLSPFLYHKACSRAQGSVMKMPGYKEYIETSPKLRYVMGCIKSQIDYHRERNEKISGQVIYMNAGVEYFPLIKEYAVKQFGLKDSQVGIVSGGMSKGAKENVKQGFLRGDIVILIGSATISVGIDLQNNATTLYNCYYDWNPTDAQQIEGRIWRQGNRFAFVRIVYPQCYNSADPVIFEYLNQKTLRINEIWNRSSEVQELDLRDFDPKQLQKKLITDPEEKAEWEILEESEKIESQVIFLQNRRDSLSSAFYSYKKAKELRPKVVNYLNTLVNLKLRSQKLEGIESLENKINELSTQYTGEKLQKEIEKVKANRYDYENDPEGKFAYRGHDEMDNEELARLSRKWDEILGEWTYSKDAKIYGDLYYDKQVIEDIIGQFYYSMRDVTFAKDKILTPLGISFDADENPLSALDEKLQYFNSQLDLLEETRPQRVERIRNEMIAMGGMKATVEDRINEFAAANEKYLSQQLFVTTPVETVPAATSVTSVTIPQTEPTKPIVQSKAETIEKFEKYDANTPEEIREKLLDIIETSKNKDRFIQRMKMAAGEGTSLFDVNSDAFMQALGLKRIVPGVTKPEDIPAIKMSNSAKLDEFYKKNVGAVRKMKRDIQDERKQLRTEQNVDAIEALAMQSFKQSEHEIAQSYINDLKKLGDKSIIVKLNKKEWTKYEKREDENYHVENAYVLTLASKDAKLIAAGKYLQDQHTLIGYLNEDLREIQYQINRIIKIEVEQDPKQKEPEKTKAEEPKQSPKDVIENQIKALNLAMKYAAKEEKAKIKSQVDTLKISLKYL